VSTIAVRAEESTPVQRFVPTAPRVVCSIFACPECNSPLIGAKFTSSSSADIHEAVFELLCDKCGWRGALLGRDAVQHMITDWSKRMVRHAIKGV
jgi:transcription elongation factor Elf1